MWICLFTCLVNRAVHLELVKELSAPLFMDGLKRFVARRSKPKLIVSDNAPQFLLVKSVLDMQWSTVFQSNLKYWNIIHIKESSGTLLRLLPLGKGDFMSDWLA